MEENLQCDPIVNPSIGSGSTVNFACMRKQQVLATVDALPDEFLAEELIERLIFMEKVDKGMRDAEEGRTITLQEAKERLDRKWQK